MKTAHPWENPQLNPTDMLLKKIECLLDVDTRHGLVAYRPDAAQYDSRYRPGTPALPLTIASPQTAERYTFGLKEVVWATLHRRFPTGIYQYNEGHHYGGANLYQLDAPPVAPRYGWEYQAGRLPALVDILDYRDGENLVRILPHNWVLLSEEEKHLRRRKLKMRLMDQINQTNLAMNSCWWAPLTAVGRVTWELVFLNNFHPQYQMVVPLPSTAWVIPSGGVVRDISQLRVSAPKLPARARRGSYAAQRMAELRQEQGVSATPGGKVRELRDALVEHGAREKFEREMISTIYAGHLVDCRG